MEISPAFLEFKPPFTKTSTEIITLTNTTDQILAFKVKTTAPKIPNASTVAPGQKLDVQIILQGLKQEPEPNFKCRDKFLVVSLPCPYELNETSLTVAQLWTTLEKQFKTESSSKKIRVIYKTQGSSSIPAAGGAVGAAAAGTAVKGKKTDAAAAAAASPISKKTSTNGLNVPDDTINDSIYSSSESPIAKKTGPVDKDLTESQKKINQLNEKLNSNATQEVPGVDGTISKESVPAPKNTVASPQSNMPVQVAAVVALIAFILAWLLF